MIDKESFFLYLFGCWLVCSNSGNDRAETLKKYVAKDLISAG